MSERGEGSKGAPAIKSSVVRPSLGSWTLSFQPAIAVPSFRNHRLLHYPKRKDAKQAARTCKYIHVESESYQNLRFFSFFFSLVFLDALIISELEA